MEPEGNGRLLSVVPARLGARPIIRCSCTDAREESQGLVVTRIYRRAGCLFLFVFGCFPQVDGRRNYMKQEDRSALCELAFGGLTGSLPSCGLLSCLVFLLVGARHLFSDLPLALDRMCDLEIRPFTGALSVRIVVFSSPRKST